jgi:hypothetical protein
VAWKDMLRSIPTIELSEDAEDTTGISRVGGTGHRNSCCPLGSRRPYEWIGAATKSPKMDGFG